VKSDFAYSVPKPGHNQIRVNTSSDDLLRTSPPAVPKSSFFCRDLCPPSRFREKAWIGVCWLLYNSWPVLLRPYSAIINLLPSELSLQCFSVLAQLGKITPPFVIISFVVVYTFSPLVCPLKDFFP